MLSKKISIYILITLLTPLLFACAVTPKEQQEIKASLPEVEIKEVKSTSINSFQVIGEVTASQSSTLTGEFRSTIEQIFAKPGDNIKKNDLLIKMNAENIETAFQTTVSSLNLANDSLNQTTGSANQNIKSAQINLEKAQIAYDNLLIQNKLNRQELEENLKSTKLNYKLSLSSAEKSLANAIQNLEKTETLIKSSQKSSENNLQNVILSANTNIQTSLNLLDQVLGISKLYEQSNDSFEKYLGTRNSKSKENAETSLRNLIQSFSKIQNTYESTYNILNISEDSLQKGIDMLNNSSSGNNFNETTLNSHINVFTNQLNLVRNNLASLSNAKNNLTQTLSSNDVSLTSAKNAVENAQKNLELVKQETSVGAQPLINAQIQYDTTLAKLNASEDDARKQIESAKINYENSLKSAELSKLGSKSALTNTLGNFEQNKINLEKLELRAPFDGTVIDIPVKTGDEVLPGKILAQIENPAIFKIITYLTPTQTKNLKIGDTVKIGTTSSDKIFAISQTVDPLIKKHKIEILHQNPYLHSGQTIPLEFTNQIQSENIIYLPLIAVHINTNQSFVWTIDLAGLTLKKSVITGEIVGNQITITDGLKEGDKVIINGSRMFKTEGMKVKIKE